MRDNNQLDVFPTSGGTVVVYLPDNSRRSLSRDVTDGWRGSLRAGARISMPGDDLHGRLVRNMNFTCCGERETIAFCVS